MIAQRAAGNPFFAEEIVRELAERGVLHRKRGNNVWRRSCRWAVPATLQATIAARIDRLHPAAKRTLNAAAVVGSISVGALETLLDGEPDLERSDRWPNSSIRSLHRHPEYAFHHPLIRTVAYETQLKSDRAELHRRLATAIEQRHPNSVDENAALIAEHFEAAGDLRAAVGWHMRAGAWAQTRDVRAARISWERAQRSPTGCPPMTRAGRRCASPRGHCCA